MFDIHQVVTTVIISHNIAKQIMGDDLGLEHVSKVKK